VFQFLFRWNGEPIGFAYGHAIFDDDLRYVAWIENDASVWNARDGRYLGHITDGEYIRRNTFELVPAPRAVKPPPPMPSHPKATGGRRLARSPRSGWIDGL